MKNKALFRKVRYALAAIVILASISLLLPDYIIRHLTSGYVYQGIDSIPANKVGLLLGTSKYMRNGAANPFFYNRLRATVELYNAHKIEYIVVSGDNSNQSYNEPRMMKAELIKMGLPDSVIFYDFAGFRTFDSVIRCRVIFGQTQFTIISQEFHLERALYIARYYGINAVGYEAGGVGFKSGIWVRLREYLARMKVFFDIYTGYEPKFLGEKIVI